MYTPDSVNCMIAGIQRHRRRNLGTKAPNIVDGKSHRFTLKRNTLDQVFRKLRSEGVGIVKKRAAVISPDQEEKLWQQGVLDLHSLQALLNGIFYYNGIIFLLRGISEHHNFHFSQLVCQYQPDQYHYIEHGSKTNDGGVKDYRLAVKNVTIIMVPDSARCHVKLLDFYLAHVPPEMVQKDS